jgi:hypothetical protein
MFHRPAKILRAPSPEPNRRPKINGSKFVHLHPLYLDFGELPMRKITIEEKWHQQSEAAKNEAEKLPYGKEREALVRKARQLQTASQINQWLSSPELQSPK